MSVARRAVADGWHALLRDQDRERAEVETIMIDWIDAWLPSMS